MRKGKQVSVVLMTYAQRASIRAIIEGFLATGLVDEVLAVNNNAEPGTAREVTLTATRLARGQPMLEPCHAAVACRGR